MDIDGDAIAQVVRAASDAFATIWNLTGPIVGGVLGATLTARHQRAVEAQRTVEAIAAEHRRANRKMYIRLLTYASETVTEYGNYALAASLVERTRTGQPDERDRELLRKFKGVEESCYAKVDLHIRAGLSIAIITRATVNAGVADRLDRLIELLTQPGLIADVPHRLKRDLADFASLSGEERSGALGTRIGELDQALADLRDAVSKVLAVDGSVAGVGR